MWWIGVITAGIATTRMWNSDIRGGLFWWAAITVVVGLWTAGIASNFRSDPQSIPNAAARLNMAAALSGVIVLIVSFNVGQ